MTPLLAVTDPKTVAIVVMGVLLAACVAVAVTSLCFKKDVDGIKKRKLAHDIAQWLAENKLKYSAEVVSNYAAGDPAAALGRAEALAHKLEEPRQRDGLLDDCFLHLLQARATDPHWHAAIAAAAAAAVPTPPPAKPAG
jgi:hypothetical protein